MGPARMAGLDAELLRRELRRLPAASVYHVAYSGGLDSHVLLHALASLEGRSAELRAIHVDHGLQAASADWARHCEQVCRTLAIPLRVERVRVQAVPGESPEAAAREARYEVFERLVGEGEALLLAHHQDDQAETLLLRLLRGAGPHGLAAMPQDRPLGRGRLLRPLLSFPRRALLAYARAHGLRWVDDPSNADARFDRNYLRAELMPLLRARWPGAGATLSRAAELCGEAAALMDELARDDLARAAVEEGLRVDVLAGLSPPRRSNLLRFWLRCRGIEPPCRERLTAGLASLIEGAADRQPELVWPGGRIRRYRGELRLVAPPQAPSSTRWDMSATLDWGGGRLEARSITGAGIRAAALTGAEIEVRPRAGGERFRPAGDRHRRSLKKLLQEIAMPPWERAALPLIYLNGELAAIGDLWVCEGFQAAPGETGVTVVWHRPRVVNEGPFC